VIIIIFFIIVTTRKSYSISHSIFMDKPSVISNHKTFIT